MSLMSALTAAQKTKLRDRQYAGAQYISLCPNTVVYNARVDAVPITTSFAELTMGATISGSTAAVKADHTVFISQTSDIKAAYFRGRARKAMAGATFYLNETSASISVNDYVFVVNDFAIHPKLSRESGGVRLVDWDITFRQLPPVIYGIKAGYAGWVEAGALEVAFSASAIAATSGATISSYAWSSPDGSVTGGATNTANVTYDFPAGFRWVQLIVTDSGGRSTTRQIPVWAHDPDTYPPALDFTGASISGDSGTWSGDITAFNGIEDVLDQTLVCIWSEEYHYLDKPATAYVGPIIDNVEMVGRLRTQADSSSSVSEFSLDTSTRFTIEDAAQQMQRLHSPILTTTRNASPTAWDQIANLTSWRAIVYILREYSTFLTCHSLNFDDTSNTYLEAAIDVNQQDIWSAVNTIADGINARIEFDPQGRALMSRSALYLTTAARAALTVVLDDGSNEDWTDIGIDTDYVLLTGSVEASGGTLSTGTGLVTPLLSKAPGNAQDYASAVGNLPGQILQSDVSTIVAQAELNQRTGDHLKAVNPADTINLACTSAYHIFAPSHSQWYKFTVLAADTTGRTSYTTDTRWLLTSINHAHDNETGTRDVQMSFRVETQGTAGQTQPIIEAGEIDVVLPELPPFPPYPELGLLPYWDPVGTEFVPPFYNSNPADSSANDWPPNDGNAVIAWDQETGAETNSTLYLSTNFLSPNPSWRDVSPTTGEQIKDACFKDQLNSKAAYCLTYDGSADSTFWYTPDIFAASPVWTDTALVGEWDYIRVEETGVYVVRSGATEPEPCEVCAFDDKDKIYSYPGTSQETLNENWQTATGVRTYVYYHSQHSCKFDTGWDGTWELEVDTEYCIRQVNVKWYVNGSVLGNYGPRAIGVTIEGYEEESTSYVSGNTGWQALWAPGGATIFNPPRRVLAGGKISLRMIDPYGFDYCYFAWVQLEVCVYD